MLANRWELCASRHYIGATRLERADPDHAFVGIGGSPYKVVAQLEITSPSKAYIEVTPDQLTQRRYIATAMLRHRLFKISQHALPAQRWPLKLVLDDAPGIEATASKFAKTTSRHRISRGAVSDDVPPARESAMCIQTAARYATLPLPDNSRFEPAAAQQLLLTSCVQKEIHANAPGVPAGGSAGRAVFAAVVRLQHEPALVRQLDARGVPPLIPDVAAVVVGAFR